MFKSRTKIYFILISGFLLIVIPSFFGRLHEDEIIYLNQVKTLSFYRVPLVYLITHFLALSDSILILRFVTTLFTIGCSILIYLIVKEHSDTLFPSFLFLISFSVLRWGIRFNMEPFATFFLLSSIYMLEKDKDFFSGIFFGLGSISRETVMAIFPVLLISSKNKVKFASTSSLIILFGYMVVLSHSITSGVLPTVAFNVMDFFSDPTVIKMVVLQDIKNWLFFIPTYFFLVIGIYFLWNAEKALCRKYLIYTVPLIIILNFVAGFIINGPFERYTIPLIGLLSIPAGIGLSRIKNWRLVYILLILHLVFLNLAVVINTSTNANSIWDFGYKEDEEIIKFLRENTRPHDVIVGIHGYFVDNVSVAYVERYVDKGVEINPDWLIVYRAWIDIKGGNYYTFGRYYVIPKKSLKYVVPKESSYWRLNKFPFSGIKEDRIPIWLKKA